MSATNGKIVTLRSLQTKVAGKIQLGDEDSPVHDVFKLTGDQYQRLRELDESARGWSDIPALYSLIHECMPSAAPEEIQRLNKDDLATVIALASSGIEGVRALFPNVESPEPQSSTSPG